MKTRLGMVTIGQAPRADVVPEMADVLGPGVEIVEAGALDGLSAREIAALAPADGDEVLVTRLTDGSSVFVAKRHILPLVQGRLDALDAAEVAMSVLLCTGSFEGLRTRRPLVEPDKILLGVIRGVRYAGRLGVLTPSDRHVEQTDRRWRGYGFDPVVVPMSPYKEEESVSAAVETFRSAGTGLLLLDCIGFRRPLREALQSGLEVPVIVANLLVARVIAEMLGA
jgi:protein AroM